MRFGGLGLVIAGYSQQACTGNPGAGHVLGCIKTATVEWVSGFRT
jgi:hypothetical protein